MENNVLSGLKPEKVFKYFEIISSIPRGSGNTKAISDYCVNFAKDKGLDFYLDATGNVIIYKSGSNGRENEAPVILQGHLDMVCEKESDCDIDFKNDGLSLAVDGDYVYAMGTTLGGDDGIAVAMCLALLDGKEYSHPPIEAVFTVDEETSMIGAEAIDTSYLKGKRMINIDSENEGVLWVSCAGGARMRIELPVQRENRQNKNRAKITVGGLHGGHSGTEIHVGYANANILMGRILRELKKAADVAVISVNGGSKDNAITRESACVVSFNASFEELQNIICGIENELKSEFSETDPQLYIRLTDSDTSLNPMTEECEDKLISLLNKLPYGVIAMSGEIDGLVETSLNIGTLCTNEDSVALGYAVRSSKDNEKDILIDRMADIAVGYGASYEVTGKYPGWTFRKDSPLRQTMTGVFKKIYGREMKVEAIHAGLECGLFCGKINGLDCVSLGPDIFDIHTPNERMSIQSVERVWQYLLAVLENL